MFRVTTYVTSSPFTSRRSRSAAAKTRCAPRRARGRGARPRPRRARRRELDGSGSRRTTNGTAPARRATSVLAREPERVRRAQHGGSTAGSTTRRSTNSGRRAAGRELEPAAARRRLEQLELRPRRLRVDVVDRHRRDAAPVVDPRVEQARELVVGEVRRRLHCDGLGQQQPRRRDRPEQLLERRLRARRPSACRASRGSSARSPPARARARPASARSRAARRAAPSRVSPIPIRIPLVNGTRASPASRDRLEPPRRQLVRRAECGPPRAPSRSEVVSSMIPIDALTGRRRASSSRVITPGLRCGSSRSRRAPPGAAREVLDRRLAPERGELVARRAVAQLRLVPEGEERLRQPAALARARDPEHLVLASCTPARRGAAAERTCSSRRRRGRASSAG